MAEYEKELKIAGSAPAWKCTVCGFVFHWENPPRGCPKCHSPSGEFIPEREHVPFTWEGEPFDVFLTNASTHLAGNTSVMSEVAEAVLQERDITYRRCST
jgi:rubredoxin